MMACLRSDRAIVRLERVRGWPVRQRQLGLLWLMVLLWLVALWLL